MVLWLVAVAGAAPRFVGEPEDVTLATAAWEAAERCAGREGRATEVVEIVQRTVQGDYLGVARTDPSGRLYRIDLNTDASRHREVLVHEVTHAWISEGPVALVEGTAELLADCVASRNPELAPLQFDDGRALSGLPDLASWDKPTEGVPSELHSIRTDAYVGAARLLRTVSLVVPQQSLFASRSIDWETLGGLLRQAGPRGQELLTVLSQGAGAQRRALADADRDGLVALAEGWFGTDDTRFDSDEDGWWDGAAAMSPPMSPLVSPPRGAVVVPLDGTPVCSGRSVRPGAALPARIGGDLRGAGVPELEVYRAPGEGARPVLFALSSLPSAESTGARWAILEGGSMEPGLPGSACRSDRTVTVWAEDKAFEGLVNELAGHLQRAQALANERYGQGPERVALALGGPRSTVEDEIVWLSTRDVSQALASGDVEGLARLAVSLRRMWVSGDRDWNGAVAVARALSR